MRAIDWIRVCAALVVTGVGCFILWRALFADGPVPWGWALAQVLIGCTMLFTAVRSAKRHNEQGASPPRTSQA